MSAVPLAMIMFARILEWLRLCRQTPEGPRENIARAIGHAIGEYDRSAKSPEPDFGEEERVADQ
jgi:hypothetical protein